LISNYLVFRVVRVNAVGSYHELSSRLLADELVHSEGRKEKRSLSRDIPCLHCLIKK